MARIETAPGARVLAGIDISKHRHEALIGVPGKQRRRRVTLMKADFERLVAIVAGYGLPVRIGFTLLSQSIITIKPAPSEASGSARRPLTGDMTA